MAGEKFGPPMNIDRYLGRAKNKVAAVGVELEGGWKTLPAGNVRPIRDGSIVFRPGEHVKVMELQHVGEIPLPPLTVEKLPDVLQLYYPYYVNKTCGMHVHMSFRTPFSYQRLMVNQPYSFPATIVEYIKRWAEREKLPNTHPIWERLEGKCEYCQHIFHAEEQAKSSNKDFDHHRHGHRYTVIGYCWGRYKTVECRLLPMMETKEQATRAVMEVVNITNAFLDSIAGYREQKKSAKIIESEDDAVVLERRGWV